jgi:hypothetical protein
MADRVGAAVEGDRCEKTYPGGVPATLALLVVATRRGALIAGPGTDTRSRGLLRASEERGER